jgi:hypothetical protein
VTDARVLVVTALDSAIASLMTSRALIRALIDAGPSAPDLEPAAVDPEPVGCDHPEKVEITTMNSDGPVFLCPECGRDDIVE